MGDEVGLAKVFASKLVDVVRLQTLHKTFIYRILRHQVFVVFITQESGGGCVV